MKRIAININHNGVDYTSDYSDFSETQLSEIKKLLTYGASNELTHLKFESHNKEYYFPSNIIKNSILSLVYRNK